MDMPPYTFAGGEFQVRLLDFGSDLLILRFDPLIFMFSVQHRYFSCIKIINCLNVRQCRVWYFG